MKHDCAKIGKDNLLYIIATTLLAFLLSSLFHYVYEWTGNSLIAGLFFPVNESVWEHLKLPLYALLIAWPLCRCLSNPRFSLNDYWIGVFFSNLIASTTTVILFYTMRGVFGLESLIADILYLLIGLLLGQITSVFLINHCNFSNSTAALCRTALLITALLFAFFTYFPPNLPIFQSP